MSLIDTQVVVNLIADIQYDDRYINNNEVFVALETVRDCVFNLPTAYDVDKVVEELDNKRYGEPCEDAYEFGYDQALYEAIDIVKRGGIDDRD